MDLGTYCVNTCSNSSRGHVIKGSVTHTHALTATLGEYMAVTSTSVKALYSKRVANKQMRKKPVKQAKNPRK